MSLEKRLIPQLGMICLVAAFLSGIVQGLWEMQHPILINEQSFAAASGTQRWAYALFSIIKSVGFVAGLFGLFLGGTKRGVLLKLLMALAVIGGVFFAVVWIYMAAGGPFTLVYVLGGMWYQMIVPVALGIAALIAHRLAWWTGAWAIIVGILNSQIFVRLTPDMALIVQGVIWVVLGLLIYVSRRHLVGRQAIAHN